MRTTPAATAAAEPPDDPPGTRAGSCGFRAGPKALCSVDEPIANSSMLVLATTTAPAARRRATAVASNGLTYPSRIRDPQLVCRSRVAMLSLTAMPHPGQRPGRFAVRETLVILRRLCQRGLPVLMQHDIEAIGTDADFVGARETRLHRRHRRDLARSHGGSECGRRTPDEVTAHGTSSVPPSSWVASRGTR